MSEAHLIDMLLKANPPHRHDHDYFHDDCGLCQMEKDKYEKFLEQLEENKN